MPSLEPAAAKRATTEFVALSALTISLVAMSIDSMLPALGAIADGLGATAPNDRQLVLTAFFAGLTAGQLLYGPLSDAVGRKNAMYAGVSILAAGTLLCVFSTSFSMMLAGRAVAGFGAAGARIISLAIVRDRFVGRDMAAVMSMISSVFIVVPIVAPAIGQGILYVGSWRGLFAVLFVMCGVVLSWFAARQAETLPVSGRRPLRVRPVLDAILEALRNRQTLAYTIAAGFVFAALVAYLATAQQIFGEQYAKGDAFPLYFAALAASIGAASLLNARLVRRFGMLTLSGAALRISTGLSGAFFIASLATSGHPPLWSFMAYLLVVFFCNGLMFGNFNALAMEPMGHIAGSAASVVGTVTSLVSVVIGTPVGRAYDGTVRPLVGGFFLLTLLALIVTMIARRPVGGIIDRGEPLGSGDDS